MIKNKRVAWITKTAMFIAVLVAMQAATAPLGMQLLTGSLVNLILIISVMTCGLSTGVSVAVVSPFFAKLVGIGPLWSIIPVLALGNLSLILLWYLIGNRKSLNRFMAQVIALAAAALCKFAILYVGVTKIMIPILNLPEKQAAVISTAFSFTQLATASIGGALAILILPTLKKAISKL